MILEKQGYLAAGASSAQEARELLLNSCGEISLIILDLMMPREDGCQFLKWLESNNAPLCDIPVIINTAKNLSSKERRDFLAQGRSIIPKGLDFAENLIKYVKDALNEEPDA